MNKLFDLNKKVVLVTGGYGHLGKAITESLASNGATVYVLGRDESKFKTAFKKKSLLKKINFELCDIENTTSIQNAFKNVFKKTKNIDCIINNAYSSIGNSPEHLTDEELNAGIDGTFNSVFKCIREIIPYFKKNKSGKIINVSSMYGVIAPDFDVYEGFPEFINPPHYGAAKAAVLQLTRYYASYLGKYSITVNSVTPGPFPSELVQRNKKFIANLSAKTCLKRVGKPEELSGAFVFLASDAANYITGQNIVVDGGWMIK